MPGGKFCKQGKFGVERSAEFRERKMSRFASKLGLNDEQKIQFESAKKNQRIIMKPLRDKKQSLRVQLKNLDPTAADYDEKLTGLANIKAGLTRQMMMARGETRKQMAKILTAEQQAKMKQMRKRRGGYFKCGGMHKHFH